MCVSLHILLFCISFAYIFSGYPRELDIPEWGKFIDILAGVQLSCFKLFFLYWKRKELEALFESLNKKSLDLRERGRKAPEIKILRDSFYFQEMVIHIFTISFSFLFQFLIFIQVLLQKPYVLVVPMSVNQKEIVVGPSTTYWIIYATECVLCPYVACVISFVDVMIGNCYNQLILHLEVLHRDMRVLDEDDQVTPAQLTLSLCDFAKRYQELRQLARGFQKCMRPFFLDNLVGIVFALVFSCVEMGIMMNVDVKECFKPGLYFLFINFPFFYWCWLGDRLSQRVRREGQLVFGIYSEDVSF